MSIRFRKIFGLGKDTRLSVNKSSIGISTGNAVRLGFNTKKGTYASGSIRGTGIYAIEYSSKKKNVALKKDSGIVYVWIGIIIVCIMAYYLHK